MSRITEDPIDLARLIESVAAPAAGAVLTFSGVVRDHNRSRTVTGIDYHAYREMAVAEMDRIEAETRRHWPEARIAIVHRVGPLRVGEESVVIAVSSPHRDGGFAALRYAIEEIKKRVPIWKKEIYPDGYAWIEGS